MAYDSTYLSCQGNSGGAYDINDFTLVTVDNSTAVTGANYVSDGVARGLKLGDVVKVVEVDALPTPTSVTGVTLRHVTAVGATAVTLA
jgi:hypothetical protein